MLLVGHSWGGVVVTEAGNLPQVKGLVYLSAMVPDNHESATGMLARLGAPMEGLQPDRHGRIWLDDPGLYGKMMAADVPAAWHDKPSWYLMTANDQALPYAVQRKLAQQIKADSLVLQTSHMSLVSQPQQVAQFILRAAAHL